MASIFRLISVTLLFLSVINAVSAVQEHEIESMLSVLRARGYTLFSNAIATSDLNFDVVSGDSFTFFAPTDASLFKLDMTYTASDYTNALRCHVIPRRLSVSELRRFPSGSFFSTLLRGRQVQVERRRRLGADVIVVDGVEVVLPGLFYGRDIAVHGLGGILNLTIGDDNSPLPSPEVSRRRHPSPLPSNVTTQPANLSANHSVGSPIASPSQLPSSSPSPSLNFSHGLPPVNSSDNCSIGSPLAGQIHAPPPVSNYSDVLSPGDNSANHSIASAPESNQTHVTPPPASNISDLLTPRNSSANHSVASPAFDQTHRTQSPAKISDPPEPPICKGIDNRTIEYLVPEPAFADGFSPAYPPELDHSQTKISPAHDLWYRVPISPASTARTAPPAPACPETDAQKPSPPSVGGLRDGDGQMISIIGTSYDKKPNSEIHDDFSAISAEDLAGIMEMVPDYLEPLDQSIFDCWLTNEFANVNPPRGYLYTRQQTPISTISKSCYGI